MKHRLLLPLMICVLALAGCYRQAEEEFQQVNSSEAEPIDGVVPAITAVQSSELEVIAPAEPAAGDASSNDGEAPSPASGFITPEPPPGQVAQPTIIIPTSIVVIAATPGEAATQRFTLPTATRTFEDTLDPEDECVYSIVRGDTLYRLSITYETSVEAFFEENNLESDALQIGQLLLIPGCERAEPEPPTAEPEETAAIQSDPSSPTTLQLPEGPRIHVVSAGETWASIALRYELSVDDILAANELTSSDQLGVGQELIIPDLEDEAPPEEATPEEAAGLEDEAPPEEAAPEEATDLEDEAPPQEAAPDEESTEG